MKLIKDITRKIEEVHQLEFDLIDQENTGYFFPCDRHGVVDKSTLDNAAYEDYLKCLRGYYPVHLPPRHRKYLRTVQYSAVGLCDICHTEVELTSLRSNTCPTCGMIYTMAAEPSRRDS